ncbi:fimbrial protein [Herbaspirillum chlorophenolicum]|uniref:Fimbrial protein n=1 Tax=Herbaspirillum chlorophenolicum TaxID=211589 RepID=A0ABW8F4T4_9BURK
MRHFFRCLVMPALVAPKGGKAFPGFHRYWRWVGGLLLCLGFYDHASAQRAVCSASSTTYNFSLPASLDINQSAAVGAVLWTSTDTFAPRVTASCRGSAGDWGGFDFDVTGTLFRRPTQVGGFWVYESNVPGIGYSFATSDVPEGIREWARSPKNIKVMGGEITGRLRLVKTGVIAAGRLTLNAQWKRYDIGASNPTTHFATFRFGSSNLNVTPGGGTCILSASSRNVDLGRATLSSMALGGTAGEFPVSVFLRGCSVNSVSMSLRPSTAVSGTACDGRMTNAGSARGIGISLSRNTGAGFTPVCWSRAFTPHNSSGPREQRYEFLASMIRLQQNASAGTVHGFVTVNVTYQ